AEWTMPNGMRVWHLEQRSAPLVSVRMVFPQGAATDPLGKEGLTSLTGDMLDEGAGTLNALEIGDAFQRLATSYGTSAGVDAVTFRLDMLADELKPSLALAATLLRQPTFPPAEFARRKDLYVAGALSRESEPNAAVGLALRRVLFGKGYLGARPGGTKTSLKRITLADVKAHYSRIFRPEGATVVVVGAVAAPALKTALREVFGDWKGAAAAAVPADVKPAPLPAKAIYLVDFPGASQSTVVAARRTPGVGEADYFDGLVFNRALGGAFSSRLNLNLREDKGYTYGANSYFARYLRVGYHGLSARVKRETTRASVDEMLREIRDVSGARPVTEQEHREAIEGLVKGFPGRFERLSSTAGQIAAEAEEGRDVGWLGAWPSHVQKVTLEGARGAAQKYAETDAYALVIAGDTATFVDAMAELGRPLYTCDREGACAPRKAPR
ncbi:MAG: pitrilysin family protein, partial [Myxococcota bacterium]